MSGPQRIITRRQSKLVQDQQFEQQQAEQIIAKQQQQVKSFRQAQAQVQPTMSTLPRQMFIDAIKEFHIQVQDAEFANQTLAQVQDLLLQVTHQYERYETEHVKLLSDPAEAGKAADHAEVHREISQMYRTIRSILAERNGQLTTAAVQLQAPTAAAPVQQQVSVNLSTADALSNITNTWGQFSGDYLQWQSFRDRFKEAIHENKEVPIIKKFHYLRASVSGAAARAMGNWPFTEQNYIRAWNRLAEVYEDEYLAIQTLVRRLLSIPKMEIATFTGLRKIIDTVHECLNQLASYVEVNNWVAFIVFMVIDLMDPATYEAWESHRETERKEIQDRMEVDETSDTAQDAAQNAGEQAAGPPRVNVFIPCWAEVSAFLEKRVRISVHSERRDRQTNTDSRDRSRDSSTSSRRAQKQKQTQAQNQSQSQASTSAGRSKPSTGLPPCPMCQQDHPMYKCKEFVRLSLQARRDFVRTNNVCQMCLKPDDHQVQPCNEQPCIRCAGQPLHNSLLCPSREVERRTYALQANNMQTTNTQTPNMQAAIMQAPNQDGAWGGAKPKVPKKKKSNNQN